MLLRLLLLSWSAVASGTEKSPLQSLPTAILNKLKKQSEMEENSSLSQKNLRSSSFASLKSDLDSNRISTESSRRVTKSKEIWSANVQKKTDSFSPAALPMLENKGLIEPFMATKIGKFGSHRNKPRKSRIATTIFDDDIISFRRKNTMQTKEIKLEAEEFQIVWELGPIKAEMKNAGESKRFNFLKGLIGLADAALKRYIKVKFGVPRNVVFQKGKICEAEFKKKTAYDAHLVVITRLLNERSDTIAQALPCMEDNKNNRTIAGHIDINLNHIVSESASNYRKLNYLMTIVHEVLHILTFNAPFSVFIDKNSPFEHENLNFLRMAGEKIWIEGNHWSETYLPNELMNPISRPSRAVSVFTLEQIEQMSDVFITDKKALQNNFAMDIIDNYSKFMNYRCKDDDETTRYPYFCSYNMVKSYGACSVDFLWRTQCDGYEKLPNNCFGLVTINSGFCLDPANKPGEYTKFEYYGTDSRCFVNKAKNTSYCLKFKVEGKKLAFYIYDQKFLCEKENDSMEVKVQRDGQTFTLSIFCPKLEDFTMALKKTSCPDYCSGHGFCSDSKCVCLEGWTGHNCGKESASSEADQIFTFNAIQRD